MKKLIGFCVVILFIASCKKNSTKNVKVKGQVFGTSYSVIYQSSKNYQQQFDSIFDVVNASMSTYMPHSIISKINNNENVKVDAHFEKVFQSSALIHKNTNGVFDPTIGAVVNAWSFGPKGEVKALDSLKIDSLLLGVGFDKMKLTNGVLSKHKNTQIDFNAIAKGYAVDVISEFLESKNCNNYLVEIGGEIRVKGKNIEKQKQWVVGIDKPNFNGEQSVFKAVKLNDGAMATSGTYRKFKVDSNGERYAHIINAKTGYPSKTKILSVSVLAKSCMEADGYATAFQAMGVKAVKQFLEKHPELKVYIIYENEEKELATLPLNGF